MIVAVKGSIIAFLGEMPLTVLSLMLLQGFESNGAWRVRAAGHVASCVQNE